MRDGQVLALAESMDKQDGVGRLRGWRTALVRVVFMVRAKSYFGGWKSSAAKNEDSNWVTCRRQRHQLGRYGRVNTIRAGLWG
jgi:hypothetical protein